MTLYFCEGVPGERGTGVGMVWVACEHVDEVGKAAERGEGGVCGAAVEGWEARMGGASVGARVGGGEAGRVGGASVGAKVGGSDGGRGGRVAVRGAMLVDLVMRKARVEG